MNWLRAGLLIALIVSIATFSIILYNRTQQFPAKDQETSVGGFEYAWVTFSTDSSLDFIVEDSFGNRTGYDPETGTNYKEIPNSSYGIESVPGRKYGENSGTKIFEVKVYGDYEFTINLFGSNKTEYFYDYSMESNVPDVYSARDVKTNLLYDPGQENTLRFSYDFSK